MLHVSPGRFKILQNDPNACPNQPALFIAGFKKNLIEIWESDKKKSFHIQTLFGIIDQVKRLADSSRSSKQQISDDKCLLVSEKYDNLWNDITEENSDSMYVRI
ncbi:hypothetical protein ACTXT7_010188 [Hymenolepis weldensis]